MFALLMGKKLTLYVLASLHKLLYLKVHDFVDGKEFIFFMCLWQIGVYNLRREEDCGGCARSGYSYFEHGDWLERPKR